MNDLVKLEQSIVALGDSIEFDVEHMFVEGMYIRQLFVPAGCVIVGKRHRHKTLNILLKGKMVINDGVSSFEVTAPFIAESAEFTKKAGYAIEDSIWCNIHVTSETDLDVIEEEFIIPEEEYQKLLTQEGAKICLG